MNYKNTRERNTWAERSWEHNRQREAFIEELRENNFYGVFGKKPIKKSVSPEVDSVNEYLERLGYEL